MVRFSFGSKGEPNGRSRPDEAAGLGVADSDADVGALPTRFMYRVIAGETDEAGGGAGVVGVDCAPHGPAASQQVAQASRPIMGQVIPLILRSPFHSRALSTRSIGGTLGYVWLHAAGIRA